MGQDAADESEGMPDLVPEWVYGYGCYDDVIRDRSVTGSWLSLEMIE